MDELSHIDEPIDDKINYLIQKNGRNVVRVSYEEEYNKMIDYLCMYWELDNEREVLKYMEENGVKFWSPFPLETSKMYRYFMYYLQFPPEFRTIKNTFTLANSISMNTPISETALLTTNVDRLFWEIRAHLFDKSTMEEMVYALEDTQKQRIAAMRNRNLGIASMASDVSVEMLMKAIQGMKHVNVENLRPNEIVNMVSAASKVAIDGNKLAEQALLLSEIIQALNEFESLKEEEMRIIDVDAS